MSKTELTRKATTSSNHRTLHQFVSPRSPTAISNAISYVNSGKFRVKTEAEQQIWNECSRLIANAIIYYNTLLLSHVYEQKAAAGDLEAIDILKGISLVAWRNVHLVGNFDLTDGSRVIDIEALAAHYQNEDFWRRSMAEADHDGPQ